MNNNKSMQNITNLFSFENASNQLEYFIKNKASQYAKMRNFDLGSLEKNFVSGLSPAITRRIISEDYVVHKILKSFSFSSVEKYIQEICWRTYWKGYLEYRPQIWEDYLYDVEKFEFKKKSSDYAKAISGETTIDCYNDWCHELIQNNYLHNHTRMWFASIWIYTLNLPWQLGAEFFMNHLHDADPASNTLSWRWVAGLHTRNKQYFASAENIKKFTENKYYPKGQVEYNSVQFLKWKSYNPIDLNIKKFHDTEKIKYLLVHENNLSNENLPHSDFLFIQKESIKTIKRASQVNDFIDKALKSFEQDVNKANYKEIVLFNFNDLDNIKKYLDSNETESIYSPYPSVGYVNDAMKDIEKNKGFKFEFINSEWDRLFWPHAKNGFFKLKKQIKTIIKDLNQHSFNF
ncbi:MAG: DNA photolyase [Candidatus Marinimicrobia bacterium]|nr:DNA photolyase [Candidatus Neomarinimicrobiota bacterium]